jgi:predicted AlkP superfamily phosphohydrolase/phosphomutase
MKYLLLFFILLFSPQLSYGYIGPGAGFAFLGSAFVFFVTFFLAILTLLIWPASVLLQSIRRRKIAGKSLYRRVIIVGLDGLDPKITEKLIEDGQLPNIASLKEQGSYFKLGTTLPALSPVAWSTFQTGVNPGAHNIFDFLTRDKRLYLPRLSSTEITPPGKLIKIFKKKFFLKAAQVTITRKSQPFWKLLGKFGIISNIIRVPISYPPEKFRGNILAAMCTPDLKGTQGSFTLFSNSSERIRAATGGEFKLLEESNGKYSGEIDGPPNSNGQGYLVAKFELVIKDNQEVEFIHNHKKTRLVQGRYSDWVELVFCSEEGKKVYGQVRLVLRKGDKDLELYVTPVNVTPDKPALPIAAPLIFADWLKRKIGSFGTLGLLEDTWARNEKAINDSEFLEQAYLAHREREKMFFELLDKTREGVCACVFDISDRVQHIFWRYLDEKHPAPKEIDNHQMYQVIPEMYKEMDKLVGATLKKITGQDLLIVMSDHGFASFRRCINLNTWLWQNGYLALKKEGDFDSDFFAAVEWSKTKAFALGLSGIYLNIKGREQYGVVEESQVVPLKEEIRRELLNLCDPKDGAKTINQVYDTRLQYKGLYVEDAPDLVIGYLPGYRVSWDSITGRVEKEIFSDNLKAWSGDHHVDPKLIPGVLFANKKFTVERAHIRDLAPTVLKAFGVTPPSYMEGRALF